jgi:hypothetical protein
MDFSPASDPTGHINTGAMSVVVTSHARPAGRPGTARSEKDPAANDEEEENNTTHAGKAQDWLLVKKIQRIQTM